MSYEYWMTSAAYALLLGVMFTLCCRPLMGILQQEGYAAAPFLKWFYRKKGEMKRRYALLFLCCALLAALFPLVFSFGGESLSTFLAVLGMFALGGLFLYACKKALKVPLRATPRAVRLGAMLFIFMAAAAFGIEAGMSALATAIGHPLAHALLRTVPLAFLPLLFPLLLVLSNVLMLCYELPHSARFVRSAAKKLRESPCLKVGITGSFAKTSVKHIAARLLEKKYRVIATPASYNTPAGIAKCVNEGGADCDLFLAEMGARKTGDIAELCDMVCPSFAILTGICPQHLETFGSMEALVREKGILAERAEHVILGASAAMYDREGALLEGRDFGAENVEISPDGTHFALVLGGERFRVTTRLLGRHAAEDIALAAALCFLLGMTPAEIAEGIPALEPIPHRLTRMDSEGVLVLDDAYNSNIAGAANAVELLKACTGRRFVVTPGLVELGELEEGANANLGSRFVGLDGVILVGETLVLSVRHGYLDAGGDDSLLRVVPTLAAAQEVLEGELREGDAVLFLNDLPDKYL